MTTYTHLLKCKRCGSWWIYDHGYTGGCNKCGQTLVAEGWHFCTIVEQDGAKPEIAEGWLIDVEKRNDKEGMQ